MSSQEFIIGVQILETLFKIIRTAVHKNASPEDVDNLIAQVNASLRPFLDGEKEKDKEKKNG